MRALHDAVVVAGLISPRDFWDMAPGEVWWVVEAHKSASQVGGSDDKAELYRLLKESQAKELAMKGQSDGE